MAEYLLLAGAKATLRAKLSEKTRFRATASMRPLMPAGSNALTMLPQLKTDEEHDLDQEPTDEEVREYVEAVQKTAKVFARYHIKTGTLLQSTTTTHPSALGVVGRCVSSCRELPVCTWCRRTQ